MSLADSQLTIYRALGHLTIDNTSDRWRRACALHYVTNTTRFVRPALPYDEAAVLRVT